MPMPIRSPELQLNDDRALAGLAWYAQRKPVYTGGNAVTLLRGGELLFPALHEAIDQARHTVWMAWYLVSSEGKSARVLQAVRQAARRGVRVHMVVDGIGSHDVPQELWSELIAAGVALTIYRPFHKLWGLFDSGQWRRMHMKLCVVDEAVGFVGGINLIDDRFDLDHGWSDAPRLDYAVRVTGPVVTPMLHTIRAIWTRAQFGRDWRDDVGTWLQDTHKVKRLKKLVQQTRLKLTPSEVGKLSKAAAVTQPMRCAFVMRDNLRQRRTIELAALQAIHQARTRIDIVTPYFFPRRAVRLALCNAASRGVKVRLLLQGKVDHALAGIVAKVLYWELQHHGVRIYEYQPAFLHAKVLCVDDEWATVGSSNLDPLSLVMNLEANLIVKDRGFVRTLTEAIKADFADSREVPRLQRAAASAWNKGLGRRVVAAFAKVYLWVAGAGSRY
jgi:cardiolipin synthase